MQNRQPKRNNRRFSAGKKTNKGTPRYRANKATIHKPKPKPKFVELPELPESKGAFAALIPQLQHAVKKAGYVTPSPIQEQAIPHLLEHRDMFACSQTGTGKTAAFILPILQYFTQNPLAVKRGCPRVLIMAPTRELAAQIGESIHTYGCYLPFNYVVIFGGVSQVPQVKKLRNGVEFLVATPGRLLDLIQQGHVNISGVEICVLDEADRMLDMGFLPDIRKIITKLPKKRQSLFFSATLGKQIVALARDMVSDPVRITIAPSQPTVERIVQKVMFVEKSNKDKLLLSILEKENIQKALVFTDMKHVANKVSQKLNKAGIPSDAIHGNKSQTARMAALAAFKKGKVRVLVATDIAARGIDVTGITHVINYCLPNEAETYIHRIGRTARADADGIAISFCSPREREFLRDIERLLHKPVPEDRSYDFHSETARSATGADARPEPRGNYGRSSIKRKSAVRPTGIRKRLRHRRKTSHS